jgi:hypothetical protein
MEKINVIAIQEVVEQVPNVLANKLSKYDYEGNTNKIA